MRKVLLLLVISALTIFFVLQARHQRDLAIDSLDHIPVELISVVDGDTLSVMLYNEKETVRIIGIDTPEKKTGFTEYECFGDETTAKLEHIIEGQDLVISLDPTQQKYDAFGRLLAHLFIVEQKSDESEPAYILVSEIMTKEGYARSYLYEIPDLYYIDIKNAEEYARSHELGMWRSCDY